MKQLNIIILAIITCLVLTSCPGGGSDGGEDVKPVNPGKDYSESFSIPASGCDEVYHLYKLNAKITSSSSTPSWLSISILSYTSGYPSIKITAQPNPDNTERKCNVALKAENNDKLTIAITQAKKEEQTGIGDVHNTTSGQPAYSPKR